MDTMVGVNFFACPNKLTIMSNYINGHYGRCKTFLHAQIN